MKNSPWSCVCCGFQAVLWFIYAALIVISSVFIIIIFLPSGRFHSKTAAFGSTCPPGDPSRCEPRQSNSPWAWRCSCPLPGWSADGGWSPSSALPRSPPPRCPWCWSACASPGRSEASPWCPGVCGFRARQQVKLGGEKVAHFYVAGSSWRRSWLVDAGGRVRLKTRPLFLASGSGCADKLLYLLMFWRVFFIIWH